MKILDIVLIQNWLWQFRGDIMNIFTMGFTQKKAENFFENIKKNKIEILLDIRLNNQSQLAGFTKGRDLAYFLRVICECDYQHNVVYAPTKEILQAYKKEEITWEEYEVKYNELIAKRRVAHEFKKIYEQYSNVLLLCSEPTPEYCHRRLLAEYLSEELGANIIHI